MMAIFKGKRSITWPDDEEYLRRYVGEFYSIAESGDVVYIGTDLPDEYTGSNYTKHIKGTVAKAKANAAQAIPEIIEIATSKTEEENKKRNIAVMLKMDGIDMIPDLRYRFTMKVVRLSGTMCLVQDY